MLRFFIFYAWQTDLSISGDEMKSYYGVFKGWWNDSEPIVTVGEKSGTKWQCRYCNIVQIYLETIIGKCDRLSKFD